MTKEDLIKSALSLTQPSEAAANEAMNHIGAMAEALTEAISNHDDVDALIGPGNLPLMHTNHTNHYEYMASVYDLYDPVSFVETVIWVFRTYRAHGFSVDYWAHMLPASKKVMEEHLSPSAYEQTAPFHDWLFEHIAAFRQVSDTTTSFFEDLATAPEQAHGG